jgi:hypothetical protein
MSDRYIVHKWPENSGYRFPFTLKISQTKQWRLLRELIAKADFASKSGTRNFLFEAEKLEPITADNRLRAVDLFLTRKYLFPSVALKLLDRGSRYGEDHPLIDYNYALALHLSGRTATALKQAVLVGYIYYFLRQEKRGNKWIQRAAKKADRELMDKTSKAFLISPYGKGTLAKKRKTQARKSLPPNNFQVALKNSRRSCAKYFLWNEPHQTQNRLIANSSTPKVRRTDIFVAPLPALIIKLQRSGI